MEVCKRLKIPICHISTDEVYGPISSGSFSEDDKLSPQNYYSATKAAAEHIVCAYSNTFKIPYTMVRMSNNYGPRQNGEKFLPTIIRSLKAGAKIPLYGDGTQVRDWIYVNEVYNISLNDEKQNKDVIKAVLSYLKLNWNDHVEHVKDRLGHDIRYSITNDKCKPFINFEPTSFDQGIESII